MRTISTSAACLTAGVGIFGCIALFGGNPKPPELPLINRLDESIHRRFEDPAPPGLGMSRMVQPSSFGVHFQPNATLQRDFVPQNAAEMDVIAALEERQTQVGFYLFGTAIATAKPSQLDFRALKGPAAMTRRTPRPAWYPGLAKLAYSEHDRLPDWAAIYSLASEAMKDFHAGAREVETTFGTWNIVARPVVASQQRCVNCHNNQAFMPRPEVKLGQVIGGVLYAFRQAEN